MSGTVTLAEPALSDAAAGTSARPWGTIALFFITLVIILGCRVFGPSDLYDKDQSKTIAYTADVVRNGRWLLPRDTLNQEATKPPLYNWMGALFVRATGRWDEFVLKLPSVLAGLATLAMVVFMARRIAAQMPIGYKALETALLAGMIWLASYPAMRQIYLARPDMLLCAFLIGAWITGTIALEAERVRWGCAMGFWICVAGAALTKGPAALLPLLYVIAAAKLIHGRFAALNRLRWWWGVPLMGILIAAWFVPTALTYKRHVYDVMIKGEITGRIIQGGPENFSSPFWQMLVWFIKEFTPWSLLVILALLGGRRWFSQPLGPAILWVILGLLFFSCSSGKRADYLAPVYPAAAVLAACWLLNALSHLQFPAWRIALIPVLIALAMGVSQVMHSREAMSSHADNLKEFAGQCRAIVGDDPDVVFLVSGYHPMLPLMGRHSGNDPTRFQLLRAKWVICPMKPYWEPVLVSKPVADAYGRSPGPLGLYRMNGSPEEKNHLKSMWKYVKNANNTGTRRGVPIDPSKPLPMFDGSPPPEASPETATPAS